MVVEIFILNKEQIMKRRSFLQAGILGSFGASLARADQKNYDSKEGPAKSIIFIYLPGGMAHQETFDPKPFAPLEYRGPLGSIETNVPGVRLGELLNKTAKITDKIAMSLGLAKTFLHMSASQTNLTNMQVLDI